MVRNALILGLVGGLLGVPCTANELPVAETLRARWADAYNSGDIEALSAMYAADARLQQGYCPVVAGRDAIKAFWLGDMGDGSATTHLRVDDAFRATDVVYVSGTYAVEFTVPAEGQDAEGERSHMAGTYLQIWQHDGASGWTIRRETWTNLACAEIRVRPGEEGAATAAVGAEI